MEKMMKAIFDVEISQDDNAEQLVWVEFPPEEEVKEKEEVKQEESKEVAAEDSKDEPTEAKDAEEVKDESETKE